MAQPPTQHIYLASRSSRRRELLKQIGISFEVLLLREGAGRGADVDETPHAGEIPTEYVARVAREKARAGWQRLGQRRLLRFPVLAADTAVAVDQQILGKPSGREQAVAFLRQLSGRSHHVHTAVAVCLDTRLELSVSSTEVRFRDLEEPEMRSYVATGEPMDKAGAYAIQGRAAMFISSIAGSYSGVMGLPLYETCDLLGRVGYSMFSSR
jgi:septum formation protein